MQQQQLNVSHNINTGCHVLSTDCIPSTGLNTHYLLPSLQHPLTQAILLHSFTRAGMPGNLPKGHMVVKWQS